MDGVLQVAENNDAAMNIDLSKNSQNWEPVRSGGKPVRLDCTGGKITFTTRQNIDAGFDGCKWDDVNFDCRQTQTMKHLGLFPREPGAYFWADTNGERLPICGGSWRNGSDAGVFYMNLHSLRSCSSSNFGFRSAYYCKLSDQY